MKEEEVKTLSDLVEFINEREEWDLAVNDIISENGWLDLCGGISDVCTDGVDKVYLNDNGKVDITKIAHPELYPALIKYGTYCITDTPSDKYCFLGELCCKGIKPVLNFVINGGLGSITHIESADENQKKALHIFSRCDSVELSDFRSILTIEDKGDIYYFLIP